MPDPSLALDRRAGWPAEFLERRRRHPRESWETAPTLGELGRFWLARHALFRELTGAFTHAAGELREDRIEVPAFLAWFRPRLGFLLQELQHHHLIEDHHFFPVFRRADPRLARGFEVLEADHHTLDAALAGLAEASHALIRAVQAPGTGHAAATDGLATVLPGFLRLLERHLEDEEDLILPLLIDRGEAGLGIG